MKLPSIHRKSLLIIAVAVLIVAEILPSVYYYRKYQTLQKQIQITQTKDDISALMVRVSKLILLPQGETPTVMTVTDKEKLSGQQFFANAKNGDKVLIYENAKKAFLYDPIADRIIETGPVALSPPTPTAQISTSSAEKR